MKSSALSLSSRQFRFDDQIRALIPDSSLGEKVSTFVANQPDVTGDPARCLITLEGPHFLNYLEGPEGVIFDP